MGTSNSHGSPSTPEWERVKRLYREPNPDPKAVVSAITSALDDTTRRGMADAGVACCLGQLLLASRQTADHGLTPLLSRAAGLPPVLAASEAIRERAERALAASGLASRFSDLALNALSEAVFDLASEGSPQLFSIDLPTAERALGSYCREARLHDVARTFLGHDLGHAYRHFVSRDVAAAASRPGVPADSRESRLEDAVARYCRETVTRIEAAAYEGALSAALRADDVPPESVQPTLAGMMQEGLRLLAVGE